MKEKLPIKIKIEGKTYDLPYEDELKSSTETINENLIEQAPLFAWYAVLAEQAKAQVNDRKLDLANLDANMADEYRKKVLDAGEKVTEKKIFDAVEKDTRHVTGVVILNAALKTHGQLQAIVRAFDHRKEMVSALASNMRKEADTGVSLGKTVIKK